MHSGSSSPSTLPPFFFLSLHRELSTPLVQAGASIRSSSRLDFWIVWRYFNGYVRLQASPPPDGLIFPLSRRMKGGPRLDLGRVIAKPKLSLRSSFLRSSWAHSATVSGVFISFGTLPTCPLAPKGGLASRPHAFSTVVRSPLLTRMPLRQNPVLYSGSSFSRNFRPSFEASGLLQESSKVIRAFSHPLPQRLRKSPESKSNILK